MECEAPGHLGLTLTRLILHYFTLIPVDAWFNFGQRIDSGIFDWPLMICCLVLFSISSLR